MYADRTKNLAAYDRRDRNIEDIVVEIVQRELEIMLPPMLQEVQQNILNEVQRIMSNSMTMPQLNINLDGIVNTSAFQKALQDEISKLLSNYFPRHR